MIKAPYLLFLGDAPDQLAAKVAQGIRDWRPDISIGQIKLPNCKADLNLKNYTLEEARENGAKTLVIGVANASLAMRQENNGCFRISSGFQDWNGNLKLKNDMPFAETTLEKIQSTIYQSIEVIPELKNCSIKSFWGGLIDLTPDALPVIDYISECEGLIVASGFSGHGFGIAPAISGIISDLTLKKKPRLPIDSFTLHRFQNQNILSNDKYDLTLHG